MPTHVPDRFSACFNEQMYAKDPAAVPPGCGPAVSGGAAPAVRSALAHAQVQAQRDNFRNSFQTTLWVEVAMFLVAVGLCFSLPGRVSPPRC